jgi:predicted dinucleotide-binding enzyme
MRVGLLGTGRMTAALGARLVRAGHSVVVGGRDPARAEALARGLGDTAEGGDHSAAARCDAVIVAVPDAVALEVVSALAEPLAGRILIDLGNPLAVGEPLAPGFWESRYSGGPSLAERMAAAAPRARVVKAFNTVYAELLEADVRPQTFVASDDDDARRQVLHLTAELGIDAVDVGPLRMSRHLEALAGFEVALVASGYSPAVSLRIAPAGDG